MFWCIFLSYMTEVKIYDTLLLNLYLLACFLCVSSHLLSLAFLMFLFILSFKGPQFPCSCSIFQILNTVVTPFSSTGTDYCYTRVGAQSVPWLEYRRAMDQCFAYFEIWGSVVFPSLLDWFFVPGEKKKPAQVHQIYIVIFLVFRTRAGKSLGV